MGHEARQDQNKQLSRRWFEQVWNQRRPETISQLFDALGLMQQAGAIQFTAGNLR